MANSIYDAKTIDELLNRLREERSLSYREMAAQLKVSHATVNALARGQYRPDPETLDKLATFAGLTREFVYELAYGIKMHGTFSRKVTELATMLEAAPEDVQAIAADALIAILARRQQ